MVKYNDLSIGENLRRIRQELDLKQYEITGGEVTRNLISIIENGKTPLSEDNARLICRNINKIMEDRDVNIIIDPEDIFNPERYEAKKQADLYIEELNKLLTTKNYNIEAEYINEIELFLNKWNLMDKKIRIYEILGDIYNNLNDYAKGYHYYIKGWEYIFNYPNRKSNHRLMLKLVGNYIITGKYKEAINLCDYALLDKEKMSNKYIGIFYYNSALAYKKLNLIDQSLEQISRSLKYIEDTDYRTLERTFILQGNCYIEVENYDEALESYNKSVNILLHTQENLEDLCLVYVNISEAYIKMNCENKAIEYIDKALSSILKLNKNSDYFSRLYSQVAFIYKHLCKFDLAEKYYNESLIYAREQNQQERIKKNILDLFYIYQKTLNTDKIYELFEDYRDTILNISLNNDTLLMLKNLEFYIINKKDKKTLELIETLTLDNEGGKKNEN